MRKYIILLLFSTFGSLVSAQSFKWYSSVEKVSSTDFYNIYLNPDITSKLQYELGDIRLFDDQNTEIPFILRLDRQNSYSKKLKKLEIIKDKYKIKQGFREVNVQNIHKDIITNFTLTFEQTDAILKIKVLGSNDKKHWFILKNSTNFQTQLKNNKTEIEIEDIPENDFLYFNFEISTINRKKVDLKYIHFRKLLYSNRNYMQLISPTFTQDNTTIKGKSIINITFKKVEYIDKLCFSFNDIDFFLRKASIIKNDTVGEKKLNRQQFDRLKTEFVLSSSSKNELLFTNFKAQKLELRIENQDDRPLDLTSIRAFQMNAFLIAHLEAGKEYTLKFGNNNIAAPLYDLNYFTDSIPLNLNRIEAGKVLPFSEKERLNQKFKLPIYVLWTLTLSIALFLGFMVFKMFKVIS